MQWLGDPLPEQFLPSEGRSCLTRQLGDFLDKNSLTSEGYIYAGQISTNFKTSLHVALDSYPQHLLKRNTDFRWYWFRACGRRTRSRAPSRWRSRQAGFSCTLSASSTRGERMFAASNALESDRRMHTVMCAPSDQTCCEGSPGVRAGLRTVAITTCVSNYVYALRSIETTEVMRCTCYFALGFSSIGFIFSVFGTTCSISGKLA